MNLFENIIRIKKIMGVLRESPEDDLVSSDFEQSYSFNPDVLELQKILKDKGYYIGRFGKNKDGLDGKYGPFTQAAHFAIKKNIDPQKFEQKRETITQKFIGDIDDSTLKNEFNFHLIPDGKNNYRSAQIPVFLNGKDYLTSVIENYGIKNVIRFNGDGADSKHRSSHPETSIEEEQNALEGKGVKFYKLSSTKDQDKVNSILSNGNTLIHCAHGADRTGGNVGGYLFNNLGWSTKETWDYTTQYNSWNKMVESNPNYFVDGGYLNQAKKFGVRDLDHAKQLTDTDYKIENSGNITVVIGGLYYATPSWMKKQWEMAGLSTDFVKFISWDSGSLPSIKKQYKVDKLIGFSKGGSIIWNEIENNSSEYEFLGLIDPTTNKTFTSLPQNVYSLSNSDNWSSYPKIKQNLKNMENSGVLTKTNSSHKKIPFEFFQKYNSLLQ